MEISELTSAGGLAVLVNIVVAMLKPAFNISGRWTHLTALLVALLLSGGAAYYGAYGEPANWAQAALTAILGAASAVGLHQATVGVTSSTIVMKDPSI